VEHISSAFGTIHQLLFNDNLVVKVEAAKALSSMLVQDTAVELLRPGLGETLKVFLRIMDEIDFEDLVKALK
jgi:hypothetical protein